MTDDQIEQEIKAKGLTAPRVTLADIEAAIAHEYHFTAEQGAFAGFVPPAGSDIVHASLSRLTFCILVLHNGHTITGESACVSAKNFDPELGRKIARQNALDKCWPLFGFALAERLYQAKQPPVAPD